MRLPRAWTRRSGARSCFVYVRRSQGRREESDRLLAEVAARYAKFFACQPGQAHAHRGEFDAAFDWLDRACGQHDPGLHHSLLDPVLAPPCGRTRAGPC